MLINLTPHPITLRTARGDVTIEPDPRGPARVATVAGRWVATETVPIYSAPTWGAVEGLPAPEGGVVYIVSGIVAGHVSRADVVSPGTGPQDGAVRVDGSIVAVTRLISSAPAPAPELNCPLCGEDVVLSCGGRCGAAK